MNILECANRWKKLADGTNGLRDKCLPQIREEAAKLREDQVMAFYGALQFFYQQSLGASQQQVFRVLLSQKADAPQPQFQENQELREIREKREELQLRYDGLKELHSGLEKHQSRYLKLCVECGLLGREIEEYQQRLSRLKEGR